MADAYELNGKYKEFILNSDVSKRMDLLKKFYSKMSFGDITSVLLSVPSINERYEFLDASLNGCLRFSELDENGIKLLLDFPEKKRMEYIKKSDLSLIPRSVSLDLISSFKDVKYKMEALDILGNVVVPLDMVEKCKFNDDDFSFIILNSDIDLNEKFDLLDKFASNDKNKSFIGDKGRVFLDILQNCDIKQRLLALSMKRNEKIKIKDKKRLMSMFEGLSFDQMCEIAEEIENSGVEISNDLGKENLNYVMVNLLSDAEFIDYLLGVDDDEEAKFFFEYRDEDKLKGELGRILKECFKDSYDLPKFVNYVLNDKKNVFSDEIKVIFLKNMGVRLDDDPFVIISRVGDDVNISRADVIKLIDSFNDKVKMLDMLDDYGIQGYEVKWKIIYDFFKYDSITSDFFEKLDNTSKEMIVRNMKANPNQLISALKKNCNLIRYYSYDLSGGKKFSQIAIESGYKPTVSDVSRYGSLKSNEYILESLINNGHPEVIEESGSFYLILFALNNGYKISDKTFEKFGILKKSDKQSELFSESGNILKKCRSLYLLEEVIITNQYQKYKDLFASDLISKDRFDLLTKILKQDIPVEKDVMEYLNYPNSERAISYFLEKGYKPSEKFIQKICNNKYLMYEVLKRYSNYYKDYDYYMNSCDVNILPDIIRFYNEKFGVNKVIYESLFKNSKYDAIFGTLNNLQLVFDDKHVKILEEYKKLSKDNLKKLYRDYIEKKYDSLNMDTLEDIASVLYRISVSNSSDIQRFGIDIAAPILDTNNPLGYFEKVEDIYVKNNLPMVGKLFSSFSLLYSDEKLQNMIMSNNCVSPSLKRINKMGYMSKDTLRAVIFSDLLKASLGSNNRSMRDYLNNIEMGTKIFKSLSDGKKDYDSLSNKEKEVLSVYVSHLNTLYNNTKEGKEKPRELIGDTRKDINELLPLFKSDDIDKLPDRIVSLFGHFLGIDSFEVLKKYFDTVARTIDERNRIEENGKFTLEKGDFVKGIQGGIKYLSSILQNGSVAGEYLGADSLSNMTPFDSDLSRILSNKGNLDMTIAATAADRYGDNMYLVLKNNGRFAFTRVFNDEDDEIVNISNSFYRLEAFYTGICDTSNSRHYGIRTGFSSSDIDYIVVDSYDKRIGLEIAKNGFYIPVVDRKTEKVVFTSKDYDELRRKMAGMTYYDCNHYNFSKLLDAPGWGDIPSVEELVKLVDENNKDTEIKRKIINKTVELALSRLGIKVKNHLDGDLSSGVIEMIDTGSTGRETNLFNDSDFDFIMRVDKDVFTDYEKMKRVKEILLSAFGKGDNKEGLLDGDFRLKDVSIPGIDVPVKIDITFVEKTDKINYSTDEALKDRLRSIKEQEPQKYKYVIGNILLAKTILKKAEVYKPNRGEVPQGGLGGVGIENWILQNNGSFIEAAVSFLNVAQKCGDSFEEFKKRYCIFDFGENFYATAANNDNYPHDDFVYKMSSDGYKKMKEVLSNYLKEINYNYNQESDINYKR